MVFLIIFCLNKSIYQSIESAPRSEYCYRIPRHCAHVFLRNPWHQKHAIQCTTLNGFCWSNSIVSAQYVATRNTNNHIIHIHIIITSAQQPYPSFNDHLSISASEKPRQQTSPTSTLRTFAFARITTWSHPTTSHRYTLAVFGCAAWGWCQSALATRPGQPPHVTTTNGANVWQEN